ncbi:MAG: SMP-30/gluconolactonase/LRE family protein [Myxococcota bacterium]
MLAVILAACTPDPTTATDGTDGPTGTSDTHTTPPSTTGTTGATGDTATTTTPTIGFDCTSLPAGPYQVDTYPIVTTEDFDFDALGSLVYSDYTNFIAVDSNGAQSVIAPGIEDTRGIQILSDGNIAAAYITQGRVGYTDRLTGASVTLVGGLSAPNAMDVGTGDVMYVSETGSNRRVISYDPATDETAVVADGFVYPNGLALNQEQTILYVGDSGALQTGGRGLYRIVKDEATGEWGDKELIVDPDGPYDGIEVDVCGNVYVVEFSNGKLQRFDPDTLEATLLVDLNDSAQFLWNAVRWGSGRGIWARDVLYVTDRHQVFGVHVGVPGRDQPVDAMP